MPYTDLADIRMYYEEEGQGLPLLLLHDGAGSMDGASGWRALSFLLAPHYRCIHVECRGHGRTDNPSGALTYALMAEDLAQVIDRLRIAPAHVAGVGDGGVAALLLARARPDLVRSLVCVGAHYRADDHIRAALAFFDPDVLERRYPPVARALAERHDPHHHAGYWRELVRQVRTIRERQPEWSEANLQQVLVPTLLIAGEADCIVGVNQALTMRREIPDAELIVLNHARLDGMANHLVQSSRADVLAPILLEFLHRHSVEQQGTLRGAPEMVGTNTPPAATVHADGRVTFRLAAEGADDVAVRIAGDLHPMTRERAGQWTLTVGPLAPEIYEYWFVVHGVKVLDGQNKWMKPGDFSASLLEIPANPPRFDQVQDVPHGTVEVLTYRSTPYRRERDLYVYLPPEYATEPTKRFPVLYLRHGNGDTEMSWPFHGRAGVILENLLARRETESMIIVMPYGEKTSTGGGSREGMAALHQEMTNDIIPLVERRYRVWRDRDHRAIAGLSMGAGQAFTMGLSHLDQYAWIGVFSAGMMSTVGFDTHACLASLGVDVEQAKRQLRLLFVSCGTEDARHPGALDFVKALNATGLKPVWCAPGGGHEMKVWRRSLHEFLPRLFKSEAEVAAATASARIPAAV